MSPSRCTAGDSCECKGKSYKELFVHFEPQLKAFQHADLKRRKEILRQASPCLIQFICEIGLNILKDNIKLPERQYETLKPHKRMLLRLCAKGKLLKGRRKILIRAIGGFLPKVLPAILSAISGFSGHALANSVF